MAKHASRGVIIAHAARHRDKKTGALGPITIVCRITDLTSQAETVCQMAMDPALARDSFPIGGHVEITCVPVQGELKAEAPEQKAGGRQGGRAHAPGRRGGRGTKETVQ